MVTVENQALAIYPNGTIQMVPGRSGYEPAGQGYDFDELDFKQSSREARRQRPQALDETHETTYTENRRLASSRTSDVGSFIDIYA